MPLRPRTTGYIATATVRVNAVSQEPGVSNIQGLPNWRSWGHNYATDTDYTAEPKWYAEEIDIAFQIDGNYKQQPYSVWLDEATLNRY